LGGFRRLAKAFGYSLAGLRHAVRHETAIRQELLALVPLVPLACLLPVSRLEALILVLSMAGVVLTEFVNSAIDHHIARAGGSETWRRMNQLKFGGCPHCPHDAPLADRGLFPLQGYLTYWTRHNQTILDVVPPDRLLPVGTNDISGSLPQIARFLGIECETLDASRSHQYPAVEKLNILGRLDPDYLEDRVNVHCAPLMTRFFPDVRCARP